MCVCVYQITKAEVVLDATLIVTIVHILQVIPRQLCDNAGFDATDVLNKLRQKHALPSG